MKVKEFFKNLFSPLMMLNCLGIIVVSVLLVLGLFFYLDIYTDHGEEIEVPNLYGQNIEVAKKKLEAMDLDYLIIGKAYRENVPDRAVIIQSVNPGEKVKAGRQIELFINTLTPTLEIPEGLIENSTLNEARAVLTSIGFKLAPVEYVKGEAKDWLLQIKANNKVLQGGSKVSAKSPLVLVVSDGSLSETFTGTDSFFNEFVDTTNVSGRTKMDYRDLEINDEFLEEKEEKSLFSRE